MDFDLMGTVRISECSRKEMQGNAARASRASLRTPGGCAERAPGRYSGYLKSYVPNSRFFGGGCQCQCAFLHLFSNHGVRRQGSNA